MGCGASQPAVKEQSPPVEQSKAVVDSVQQNGSVPNDTTSKQISNSDKSPPVGLSSSTQANGQVQQPASMPLHQEQMPPQDQVQQQRMQQQPQTGQQLTVEKPSGHIGSEFTNGSLSPFPAEALMAPSMQIPSRPAAAPSLPPLDHSPPRTVIPQSVPVNPHPVASYVPFAPTMLSIGGLSSQGLHASPSGGALHTGVLASQAVRLPEGSSAVGESGELMLPYPAPYIPTPSTPAPDFESLPSDHHWQPQRRKAVLIGCNYVRSPAISQLKGCVNDMRCMCEMLKYNFGFQAQDMLVLEDIQNDPEYIPTKGNILAAADWLVADAQAYDSLLFFFSGYGGQLIEGGDHEHPCGDTMLPIDHDEVGHITAEELEMVLLQDLPFGVRLHAVIDASPAPCPMRLPCSVSIQPNGWGSWKGEQTARALPRRVSKMPDTEAVDAAFQVSPLNPIDRRHTARTNGGEALLFTSSWSEDGPPDPQTMSTVKSTGAMAYCLIQAVQLGHSETYSTLIRAMRYALKNGPQHFGEMPRLTSSLQFNLNRRFVL